MGIGGLTWAISGRSAVAKIATLRTPLYVMHDGRWSTDNTELPYLDADVSGVMESETASSQKNVSQALPWLSVKGHMIVRSSDDREAKHPFIPLGIGYARNVIIRAQDDEVMRFCKEHSLNTVRLAFYTRHFNNDVAKPIDIDAELPTFCDPVIDAAKRNGLYVILDDHEYFSERIDESKARQAQKQYSHWDEVGVQEWIARWVKVATRYKDEPNVLGYELCNEPHDLPPETVRDLYIRCIKAIREVDQRHIVIVGTADWSHSRALEKTWGTVARTLDAPFNQVVFAFHDYPHSDEPWLVQEHVTAFRDKYDVPVLCTEFGATWWQYDETTCRKFEAGMLALFAKEDIGWMVWALKTIEDDPRNPHPSPRPPGVQDSAQKLHFDSCAYSDLWSPVARIMGSK